MKIALEDGGGAAVGLGGGVGRWRWEVALGGGVGRWRWMAVEDAAVALGSSGGRRKCNDGIGVSVVEAKGLLL
jgi:hypothetical protein